jgi:hypothetical protein
LRAQLSVPLRSCAATAPRSLVLGKYPADPGVLPLDLFDERGLAALEAVQQVVDLKGGSPRVSKG